LLKTIHPKLFSDHQQFAPLYYRLTIFMFNLYLRIQKNI